MDEFLKSVANSEELIFVGIDPGSEGAIGFLCGNFACVVDIPTYKTERSGKKLDGSSKTKTLFDHRAIVELFKPFNPLIV